MAKKFKISLTKLLVLALILRVILVFISSYHPDLPNHIDWGNRFLSYGSKNFYENSVWGVSWPNQPFGSMFLFASIAWLKNIIFNSLLFLNNTFPIFPSFIIPVLELKLHSWMVKLPFILADLGIGVLIYQMVKQFNPKKALLAASFFLFNPVLIYNSAIWGQTDPLINLLALSGLYLTFKKQYFWGIILFLSSFLFKLSLIIYLPIFDLLLIKQIKDWKKFVIPTLTFIIFIYFLAIPFAFGDKNPFEWIWYMYTNRVLSRQGSMLNGNAFNFWFILFGVDFSKSEFTKFGPLTYQLWSRLIYILFLIPVCFKFLKSKLNIQNLLIALMLSGFGSFVFLTNMHERYLYPIFPILITLIFLPKSKFKIKSLVVLSIIHFINLYNLWFYPLIPVLKQLLITNNFLFCRFLSGILIIICFNFLVKFLKSEN